MRLWTIQTEEIWARAEESGVLECTDVDVDKAIDSWFRPAYDWMVGQLEQRVKNYPSNKYPIFNFIRRIPYNLGEGRQSKK
ncbi:MAG: DUF3841 domain-containing protein [Euryarchaeota archaeon]|nr:DUF3841 domain-containing protein [Euryarchaeota archaeon]